MSLIDKMHKMYAKDVVTTDILKSVEKALENAQKSVDELGVQRFLNYAGWEVGNIESDLGITKVATDIAERRKDVRIKLTTREKPTLEGVHNIVKRFLSDYNIKWLGGVYMLYVVADADVLAGADTAKMEELLRAYIPAHIGLSVGVCRREWGEVTKIGKTWGELNESVLSWKELREKREI